MKPGNVFLYDSLDKHNAQQHSPIISEYKDYRITITHYVALFIAVLVFFLIGLLAYVLTGMDNIFFSKLGYITFAVLAILLLIGLSAATFIGISYLANRMRKAGLVNVMEYQTSVDMLTREQIIHQYFDVAGRRADRSSFAGVQNLTYAPQNRYEGIAAQREQVHSAEDDIHARSDEEIPLLSAMLEKGLIARSHESMLLGFINVDDTDSDGAL